MHILWQSLCCMRPKLFDKISKQGNSKNTISFLTKKHISSKWGHGHCTTVWRKSWTKKISKLKHFSVVHCEGTLQWCFHAYLGINHRCYSIWKGRFVVKQRAESISSLTGQIVKYFSLLPYVDSWVKYVSLAIIVLLLQA